MISHKYLYCSTMSLKRFIINNYIVTASCILMPKIIIYIIFLALTCSPISSLVTIKNFVFLFILCRFVKYIYVMSIN